ncbi:MAG: LpqB family beta-propeller domain-containing protein [Rhodoluna sp.]
MKIGLKLVSITAAAILVLSGCAQLPRSGEIKIGPEIKGDIANDYLYYSPSGPSDGESQQEILNGFINAGTGPQNDYEAAREYLTQSFKTKWNPNSEVLIQQGNPIISFDANQQASVTVQVQATVDADGHYKPLDSGSTRFLNFRMERENGQWRISSAPDLTMLIRPVFDVIFRSYSIYFFDGSKTHLVPDLRWFPSRASTATRMVNAILKGPSAWLKDSVVTAIPAGTALSLNSVTVADGVASVDLNAKVLTAKPAMRRLMKAQIRATLTQLPNIFGVNISVERGPQEILDIADLNPTVASSESVVLQAGELQFFNDGMSSPIGGTADLIARTGATDFAMTASQDWVALKGPKGIYRSHIGIFGVAPSLIDSRPGQLTPMFDAQANLWTMTRTAGEAVEVTTPGGLHRSLKLGWLDSFPRRQFALSAEGARIATLVGSGESVRVYISGVVRDASGLPVSFGAPLEVVSAQDSPLSVSWADENTISVLHRLSDGSIAASLYTIGGAVREIGSLVSGKALEARTADSTIYSVDARHNLYAYKNMTWTRIASNVLAHHFSN